MPRRLEPRLTEQAAEQAAEGRGGDDPLERPTAVNVANGRGVTEVKMTVAE